MSWRKGITGNGRSTHYTYRGYTISRGSYVNTCDDRYDGWYVNSLDSDAYDRRGQGFPSVLEAKDAIDASIYS